MALEKELQTFEKLKPELLSQQGKYAVISGDDLLGIYSTYEDALKIGYEKRQLEPFLVKEIQEVEPVYCLSCFFDPCRT